MKTLVVDASVAAKWFLPANTETLTQEAFDLLREYSSGGLRFVVPDLFWSELTNIFWKAARTKRWSIAAAEEALQLALARDFPVIPAMRLTEQALRIALTFDRTVYDAMYVAAALFTKTELVTADEKLANALASRLPVKWLGALA